MKFALALLVLLQCFIAWANAARYSYWIHGSCLAHPKGPGTTLSFRDDGIMDEVFAMAKAAADLMPTMDLQGTGVARELARSYAYIFTDDPKQSRTIQREDYYIDAYPDQPRSDTIYNIVYGTLRSMAEDWEEVGERLRANVRIYCDNGGQYLEQGLNVWRSETNNIQGSANCIVSEENLLMGFVSTSRISERHPDRGRVAVMTICEDAFEMATMTGNSRNRMPGTIRDLHQIGQIDKAMKANWFHTISLTILHEFMHTWPYLMDDFAPEGSDSGSDASGTFETGGWNQVMQQDEDKAALNAESYAFFGLLSLLISGTATENNAYALDRKYIDDISTLEEGIIRLYEDLMASLRRFLKARAADFSLEGLWE